MKNTAHPFLLALVVAGFGLACAPAGMLPIPDVSTVSPGSDSPLDGYWRHPNGFVFELESGRLSLYSNFNPARSRAGMIAMRNVVQIDPETYSYEEPVIAKGRLVGWSKGELRVNDDQSFLATTRPFPKAKYRGAKFRYTRAIGVGPIPDASKISSGSVSAIDGLWARSRNDVVVRIDAGRMILHSGWL